MARTQNTRGIGSCFPTLWLIVPKKGDDGGLIGGDRIEAAHG
jgi:hypothetical protein